jgi:hypothetical protein
VTRATLIHGQGSGKATSGQIGGSPRSATPCRLVTQGIETRSLELGSSVSIVPKNMPFLDDPSRSLSDEGPQERYLLFDRLRLMLLFRRHSNMERCSHDLHLLLAESSLPSAAGVGTRDPTVAAHPGRRPARVPPASFCAPAFPRTEFEFSTEVAAGESSIPVALCHHLRRSLAARDQQNMSFVNNPLRKCLAG